MKRRKFLKTAVVGAAAGTVAAPAVLRAETFKWKMTTSFPRICLVAG
jgi:TRAP-type mannitol/chloroaromatic compound transport system substrate-binding protein